MILEGKFPLVVLSLGATYQLSLSGGSRGGARGPSPPLFSDQTKNFFRDWTPPPPLPKGLDDRAPSLSQGLDMTLSRTCFFYKTPVSLLWPVVYVINELKRHPVTFETLLICPVLISSLTAEGRFQIAKHY